MKGADSASKYLWDVLEKLIHASMGQSCYGGSKGELNKITQMVNHFQATP